MTTSGTDISSLSRRTSSVRAFSSACVAGRSSAAAARYRAALASAPDDPMLWYALARALRTAGQAREAAEAASRAAGLDPVLAHARLFQADRLWMNGEYEEALARYRDYLDDHRGGPFTAYALRRVGGCLVHLGRIDDAMETYRNVLVLAPEHADTHVDLGVLLRDRNDLPSAVQEFMTARRILPDLAAPAMALGTTFLLMGDPARALTELQAAVARKPCWAAARGNLAAALAEAGKPREAAGQLRVALALQPGNPRFQDLARQLRARGVPLKRVAAAP